MRPAPVASIADYGLIGDGRTAALCSAHGSIDWLCLPRFDSEPVFGRLIGGDGAGCFSIEPEEVRGFSRRYRDGSSVLETTWSTPDGEILLTEGMVLQVTGRLLPQALLVRRVESQRGGRGRIRVSFDPRAGLRGGSLALSRRRHATVLTRGSTALTLQSDAGVEVPPGREVTLELEAGRPVTFAL
jgi:hypothetical protein